MKLIKIILYLTIILISNSLHAFQVPVSEEFNPLASLENLPKGKELLDIIKLVRIDHTLAKQQLDDYISKSYENESFVEKIAIQLAHFAIYEQQANFTHAEKHLVAIYSLGVQYSEDWAIAESYQGRAKMYLRRGDFKNAMEYANKAIELAASLNYLDVIASSTATRAILHGTLGNNAQAIIDSLAALEYYERNKDQLRIAVVYANIVTLFIYKRDYITALKYSDKAITTVEALPNKDFKLSAGNYINRAIILGYLERPKEELEAFIVAQKFASKSEDKEITTTIEANLSDYFLRHKNYQLTKKRAQQCIINAEIIKNINLAIVCGLNEAMAKIMLGDKEAGIKALHQNHDRIIEEKLNNLFHDVYQMLATAYEYNKDYQNAFIWFKKYHEHQINQIEKDKREAFQALQGTYQARVDETDKDKMAHQNKMASDHLKQKSYIDQLWIIISILTITLIFSFFTPPIRFGRNK
ncbi:MAG: tetratricopeptide (TPR) repeat protein [Alteromonadaceae bacterium]|jgi:tetratricopeptide (TPR) repeat protein